MAESGVENNSVSNCFCHQCSVEIAPKLPDFTCPRCNSGFIEILEGDRDSDSDSSSAEDFNMGLMDFVQVLTRNSGNNTPDAASQSNTDTPSGGPSNNAPGPRRVHWLRSSNNPRQGWRRSLYEHRQQALAPIIREAMMQMANSFMGPNAGADLGVIQETIDINGLPMFFSSNLASNPGDYAWGRGGLDTIISQLMNQLDGTGPPPLPQEKINEIPTVKISQEQCDKHLQCTVCMEDFQLDEGVRKLNCGHCYHDDCIIPWLQLHGTCPVCRKALVNEAPDSGRRRSRRLTGFPEHARSNEPGSNTAQGDDSTAQRNFLEEELD